MVPSIAYILKGVNIYLKVNMLPFDEVKRCLGIAE
jgi:hypothetical protein